MRFLSSTINRHGSFSEHYEMEYSHDDITAFDFEKLITEESLNYKNEKKNIKAADVMRQKSSAVVGSKE